LCSKCKRKSAQISDMRRLILPVTGIAHQRKSKDLVFWGVGAAIMGLCGSASFTVAKCEEFQC
jgi:hypothetical protein